MSDKSFGESGRKVDGHGRKFSFMQGMPAREKYLLLTGVAVVLIVAAWLLRFEGRSWWCSCRQLFLWAGEICSAHNSQHLFDPYTFTHVLHGVAFCGLLALILPRLHVLRRLLLAIALEAAWEVFENSAFVIERYREATAALGYQGDTVANSLSDIFCCAFGFTLARYLGWRRSLALFAVVELILIFWVRDSLMLQLLMLIYPIDVIKTWQMCR